MTALILLVCAVPLVWYYATITTYELYVDPLDPDGRHCD